MKYLKKVFAGLIATLMLTTLMPTGIFAAQQYGEYSIANEYLKYTIDSKTGGFSIDTKDGHPQKRFDNNIPLLYKESSENSNGTSFTTVRLDGKDYIFGQEYGWFGISTQLHTPVISDEGRLITVQWDIKGYSIIQKVALSIDENNNLCGNVGISYEVKNNNTSEGNVGIRLLLDNALDSDTDAPYVLANDGISPTIVETEFTGSIPKQLRYMNSVSTPSKMAYAILSGWSGTADTEADKIIVGHWANLANTRYNYTADASCDFSNYSNSYRTPDTATCFYWSEKALGAGQSRVSEILYGIGNFSKELNDKRLGLDITTEAIQLNATGDKYINDGKFNVKVNIDNSVDGARILLTPVIKLTVDDGLKFVKTGTNEFNFTFEDGIDIGSVKEVTAEVVADKQIKLTSKRIVVSVTGSEIVDEHTNGLVEYSANRNVVLPAVGGVIPDIQMTEISPKIAYTSGEKSIAVSGKMDEFKALAGSVGWDMYLVSNSDKTEYKIDKKKIAFIDESYETISFSTSEELAVGKYSIIFKFTDAQLKAAFGNKITAAATLEISNNPIYKCKSYGIVAMTRFETAESNYTYDLLSFANEEQLAKFEAGNYKASGLKHNNVEFKEDKTELLLTVRGAIRELQKNDGTRYYQANAADGDITLNNILTYTGEKPLSMTTDGVHTAISGDGTIKVINSINIWHNKWSFNAQKGIKFTLDMDEIESDYSDDDAMDKCKSLDLQFDGAGSMLQSIAGFLIDLKYGQLSKSDDLYGISFGGKITLPIGGGKKDAGGSTGGAGGSTGGASGAGGAGGASESDDDDDAIGLSAEISDILYGGGGEKEPGFIGIDTTLGFELPENVLGSLVKNVGGVEASIQINTIDNYYKLEFGIELAVIECQGVIAFKQVPIKSVPRVVPDELQFRVSGIPQIPIVPPFVFMTGIGGGISDLADSMSDELTELPPVTLHLYTQLLLIETLKGDFNLAISLSGMSLDGEFKLIGDDDGKIMKVNGGLSARWLSPFYINAYGRVSIIDGLVKGGITITISDDYFYGYIYATLCIPDSIPIVGGKELAGIEAAVSSDFIGANLKIIGIKFGFIYYWDGDWDIGGSIDLSSRAAATKLDEYYYDDEGNKVNYSAIFGTNLNRLKSVKKDSSRTGGAASVIKNFNPSAEDALLFEIPFTGVYMPSIEEVTLKDPNGNEIPLVAADDEGNGNFIVQDLGNGKKYIYITIVDKAQLVSGDWSVSVATDGVEVSDFEVDGVDNIPEITGTTYTVNQTDSRKLNVSWTTDCDSDIPGTVDIYLTKNPNALEAIKSQDTSSEQALSDIVSHVELEKMKGGSTEITIPETYADGKYYVVTTLSQYEGGMSTAISADSFDFVNTMLPKPIDSAVLFYNGNSTLKLSIDDNDTADYTNYGVELLDENKQTIKDSYNEYSVGDDIILGTNVELTEGKTYYAKVTTFKMDGEKKFISTNSTLTDGFVMVSSKKPVLKTVVSNISADSQYAKTNEFNAEYEFDSPVIMYSIIDGQQKKLGDQLNTSWTINTTFEDGSHSVDFKAVNDNKDTVTGRELAESVDNAIFGYTVDTTAPVLSFGQKVLEGMDENKTETQVSTQTVFMDDMGNVKIEGITEADTQIQFDKSSDGITVKPDGSFVIERTFDVNEVYRSCVLSVKDKAGNETSVLVNVVNSGIAGFESLKLYADAVTDLNNGIKSIEMTVGSSVTLSAKGISKENEMDIDGGKISWNVLYEQNVLKLKDGVITAINPGETAIRASYDTIGFESDEIGNTNGGLSDVIVVKVKDTGYRYSIVKTDEYTLFEYNSAENEGDISITIDEVTTHLMYDENKKVYVGAFTGNLSSDDIIAGLKADNSLASVKLVYGDIDNDGEIGNMDVDMAVQSFMSEITYAKDEANAFVRGDINGDGKVDLIDAQLMLIRMQGGQK